MDFNICLWDADDGTGTGLEISKEEDVPRVFVRIACLTEENVPIKGNLASLKRQASEDGALFKVGPLKRFLKKAICLLEESEC